LKYRKPRERGTVEMQRAERDLSKNGACSLNGINLFFLKKCEISPMR